MYETAYFYIVYKTEYYYRFTSYENPVLILQKSKSKRLIFMKKFEAKQLHKKKKYLKMKKGGKKLRFFKSWQKNSFLLANFHHVIHISFAMEDSRQMSDDNSASENSSVTETEINDENKSGNPRLADALVKALRMGKSKNGRSVVLSKAKLYNPKSISKKPHGFEIVPDPNQGTDVEEKVDVKPVLEDLKPNKKELKKYKITKQEKFRRGRLKPSPLDKEKEKPLVKIATRGVVQLFNAVRQQQCAINREINKPGVTEGKKEKILKSFDKKAFLDVLMGRARNENEVEENQDKSNITEDEVKTEPEDEPSWKVLRDDFMMGAKLKDWDKKNIEVMEE